MPAVHDTALLRIGELSRRSGVSPDVLRVWERRYGLLRPERTDGGFRLYTAGDEDRVRSMRRHLARGFDVGVGPRALLACPEGERHDMALLCFGIGLRDRGWRITYLGADTPLETLADAARRLSPDLVVVCAEMDEPLRAALPQIALLSDHHVVALAGRGASAEMALSARARLLQDAPMAAAARIALEV